MRTQRPHRQKLLTRRNVQLDAQIFFQTIATGAVNGQITSTILLQHVGNMSHLYPKMSLWNLRASHSWTTLVGSQVGGYEASEEISKKPHLHAPGVLLNHHGWANAEAAELLSPPLNVDVTVHWIAHIAIPTLWGSLDITKNDPPIVPELDTYPLSQFFHLGADSCGNWTPFWRCPGEAGCWYFKTVTKNSNQILTLQRKSIN